MKDMLHATGHGSLALCRAQNAPSGCGPAPCHTLPWQLPARLPAQPRLPADCAPAWSCPCHRQTPAPHAFRKVPRDVSLDARSFRSHSHDDPGWPDQPHLAFRLYATSLPSLLQSSVLHMVDGCVRGCGKATSRWEVCVCVSRIQSQGGVTCWPDSSRELMPRRFWRSSFSSACTVSNASSRSLRAFATACTGAAQAEAGNHLLNEETRPSIFLSRFFMHQCDCASQASSGAPNRPSA